MWKGIKIKDTQLARVIGGEALKNFNFTVPPS